MRRSGLASVFLAGFCILAGGAALAAPTFEWLDQHDGGALYTDDGYCLATDPDGNVVIAGESSDPVGGTDLFIRKLNKTNGTEIWQRRYVGFDEKDVAVTEITWDSVGQLIVAGFIRGCVG